MVSAARAEGVFVLLSADEDDDGHGERDSEVDKREPKQDCIESCQVQVVARSWDETGRYQHARFYKNKKHWLMIIDYNDQI